jgi:Rrf2 family protein
MRLTVKSDYAIRALAELAARSDGSTPVTAEELADAQGIPRRFLLGILAELRREGLIISHRGVDGGFTFRVPPEEITVADIIRSIDGMLAQVGDERPGEIVYTGAATVLADVWVAVRASLRSVLEEVTVADLAAGRIPPTVEKLTRDPDNWLPRGRTTAR